MKKALVILLALLLALSFAACGEKKNESSASETEAVKFTVGFDAEYPPYGYLAEDGTYTGFDLELAEEVCKIYGWELVKQPIDWASKDFELNSGSIDCIWNGFTYNGRENDYTWTEAYVDNSIVWIVKKDSGITTAEDLAGKNVVTQDGSSAATALTATEDNDENLALAATFASLKFPANFNTCFEDLASGVADAIAIDIGVAKYQLENRGTDQFVMLEKPLSTEQYAVGFKLGNTELRDKVQAGINTLVENGKFMQLAEKYGLQDMVCLGK
ncbi:MAG: transporter substrate-binding domain-containing protein [Oscillospiraceae bacterium]|nr:transporter substrate-binding domain-containing protein [Oscillospiraceae bacterium]